ADIAARTLGIAEPELEVVRPLQRTGDLIGSDDLRLAGIDRLQMLEQPIDHDRRGLHLGKAQCEAGKHVAPQLALDESDTAAGVERAALVRCYRGANHRPQVGSERIDSLWVQQAAILFAQAGCTRYQPGSSRRARLINCQHPDVHKPIATRLLLENSRAKLE